MMSTDYQMLLWKAEEISQELADILRWYNDIGMELIKNDKFGYILRPVYAPKGGWQSEEEWLQEKRWLVPYTKDVMKILKELRMEEEICF